jgi:hypothetical protein
MVEQREDNDAETWEFGHDEGARKVSQHMLLAGVHACVLRYMSSRPEAF